jgi:hypothetical protein
MRAFVPQTEIKSSSQMRASRYEVARNGGIFLEIEFQTDFQMMAMCRSKSFTTRLTPPFAEESVRFLSS